MASGCSPGLNYNSYTSDGNTTTFTITFGYHDAEDIRARLNNVELDNSLYAVNPGNSSEVIFTTAPASGTLVIYRCTDLTSLSAVFNAGSTIRAVDLNDNFDQLLYAIEDVNNLRANDLANSAVNLGYVSDVFDPADSPGVISNNKGTNAAIPIATSSAAGLLSGSDKTRLDGIEDNATADQTAAEIRTLVESATDSNVFTDADHSKLNGIEAGATGDLTGAEIKSLYEAEADTNAFTDADHTKLDGIEAGATADQTAAEIRTLVDTAVDSNVFTDADHSKLDGIESGATADQTAAEIRTLVDSATDSNVFTDADHSKLDGIEANATADQTAAEIRSLVDSATDSNVFTDADHTKLDGIEANATGDLTGAEIKALYEVETNAFTDAQFTKLAGIETGATADQTAAEIRTLVESATDSNVFTDADHTKLNGIEAGATADQTKADIDALGIDAATLDGIDSGSFLRSDQADTGTGTLTLGTVYTGGSAIMSSSAAFQVNGFSRQGTIYLHDLTNNVNQALANDNGTLEWDGDAILTASSTAQTKSGDLRIGDATYNIAIGSNGTAASGTVGHNASNSEGIFWHTSTTSYGIFRTAGNWTSPTYQQLELNWPVGININAGSGGPVNLTASQFYSNADLRVTKSLPKLILDSPSSGDNWTDQGAQISLGESGDGGSAAMHFTYRGDGYGYIGMGALSSLGIPAFSHMRFKYNADEIIAPGLFRIDLPGGDDIGYAGSLNTLQVYQPTAGADAVMTFHVSGTYAVHFGLDGGNYDLYVGGWSKGSGVKHKIWHEGQTSFTSGGKTLSSSVSGYGGTGSYGSWVASGTTSGWAGYNISGRVAFMHNNSTTWGLYDDVNNKWALVGVLGAQTALYYNGSERLRTSSSGVEIFGDLFAGSYGSTGSNGYKFDSAGVHQVARNTAASNSVFQAHGGSGEFRVKGDGDCQNTGNSYGAISDVNLKENIVDANSQWDDIKSIQIRKYNFKEETGYSTHTQIGVIAQELEPLCPGLVSDSIEEFEEEDGTVTETVTKTVSYSVLYMKAIKALQEAMTRIETLEQQVSTLMNPS